MPRSFLAQLSQVEASATYDDAVSTPHAGGVAEGQTNLEGDLNVIRTLMKDLLGTTNWYDAVDLTQQEIANRFFIELLNPSGFENVASGTGTSSTAFDTAIKTITNHNNGGGNSTTQGVVVDSTKPLRLAIRNHATQNPIDDGSGNEVYGRLSYGAGTYTITWYSMVSGVETSYNFTSSVNLDLANVPVSRPYKNLTWSRFLDSSFHDTAGFSGSIADDNVTVNGMSFLLAGLTTQAQVNDKLDKLGSTANGEGASGVAIEDASSYYTGTELESVTNELEAQIGGDTSTTYNFAENNVLADNDAIYAALNKLDLKWGDLASVSAGEGASLVGVEDSAGYYTGTDVEAVLAEIGQKIADVAGWEKETETVGPITSGTAHTIPGGKSYTIAAGGKNMDVYYRGQLLTEGASNDYIEFTTTQIKFNFTVAANSNMSYMIRK